MAWTDIPNSAVDADSPLTEELITALRDNPAELAKRGTGSPWLNGIGAVERLTGSGNYIVPAGVYRILIKAKGAGASGRSSSSGSAGGATTFGGITAPGGNPPGGGSPTQYKGGIGGVPSASTGVLTEVLIPGADGQDGTGLLAFSTAFGGRGAGSILADGGDGAIAQDDGGGGTLLKAAMNGRGFGAGGGGHADKTPVGWGGGAEGATVIAVMAVTPGQSISFSIGAGGTQADAGNGSAGTIILEY